MNNQADIVCVSDRVEILESTIEGIVKPLEDRLAILESKLEKISKSSKDKTEILDYLLKELLEIDTSNISSEPTTTTDPVIPEQNLVEDDKKLELEETEEKLEKELESGSDNELEEKSEEKSEKKMEEEPESGSDNELEEQSELDLENTADDTKTNSKCQCDKIDWDNIQTVTDPRFDYPLSSNCLFHKLFCSTKVDELATCENFQNFIKKFSPQLDNLFRQGDNQKKVKYTPEPVFKDHNKDMVTVIIRVLLEVSKFIRGRENKTIVALALFNITIENILYLINHPKFLRTCANKWMDEFMSDAKAVEDIKKYNPHYLEWTKALAQLRHEYCDESENSNSE